MEKTLEKIYELAQTLEKARNLAEELKETTTFEDEICVCGWHFSDGNVFIQLFNGINKLGVTVERRKFDASAGYPFEDVATLNGVEFCQLVYKADLEQEAGDNAKMAV